MVDSVRDLAKEVIKTLEKAAVDENYAISAILGFFKGVARGTIKTGQEWPLRLLIEKQSIIKAETLEAIVASGMFCGGQQLESDRGSGFSKRT